VPRPKKQQPQKTESPIQFRAGSELGQLIAAFAAQYGLTPPVACRALVALAVCGMDRRFFPLMRQMAAAVGEENAFLRVCVHVHTAVGGGERALGRPILFDPERSLFIVATVREFLRDRGVQIQEESLWFLPEQVRETVRAWDAAEKKKPEWSSTRQPQGQRARVHP
jgi:hypothetical protein